jgi:membrane-associated phospholipid phosphatase
MHVTTLRGGSGGASEPLLPVPLRILAAALLAACVAVPAVLAVQFVGSGQPGSLDSSVDPVVINFWRYSALSHGLSELGTLGPVALMTLALVAVCVAARRWSGAVLTAVAIPAAAGLAEYVLRPHLGDPIGRDFPSGHAASVFGLAAVCVVLLADPPRRRVSGTVRVLLAFVALALATAAAAAGIAVGARHFTDALAGAAVGTGVALACALALDLASSFVDARSRAAKWTETNCEAKVWEYFYSYVDSGKPGYDYVLRHPGKSFGALAALYRLPCLKVAPSSAGLEGPAVQALASPHIGSLLSPRSVFTGIAGFATSAIILPAEPGAYSLGASKQTLRRKVRQAQKLGVRWGEVHDPQERQDLLKLAEEYERIHPDPTYRNLNPDLSGLFRFGLWLAAYSADGQPLLLSVTPADGEVAVLHYFRSLGTGEAQSNARYLMTQVLAERLVARGVRYLLDGASLVLPNGIRHFQRMVGFRIVRIRVARPG